jgi:hypothetical protein
MTIRHGHSVKKNKDGTKTVKVKVTTRKHSLAEKLAMKVKKK